MSHNVLFEIGIEELPARFIDDAEAQLLQKTKTWLTEQRLTWGTLETFSTPRRLAIRIRDIADKQAPFVEEVRGPALKIAKDEAGNWTKAAIGFTRGQGKTTDDIYTKEVKGTEYIFVEKEHEAKATAEILTGFSEVIESIHFPQTMKWSTGSFRYARPIRWILALYHDQVIPFEVAGVKSDQKTYGHRFLGREVTVIDPLQYENLLEDVYVIVDKEKRTEMILDGIKQLEQDNEIQIHVDPDLLVEVRNLVEYPTVFMGQFEEAFLQVPAEVLITSMKEHQRYFPVYDQAGQLKPYFVGVRNGDEHGLDKVVRGNEKVLRARLSDAQFFYEEDLKHSIDVYQEKLTRLVFQEKLGTVSEKVARVKKLTAQLAKMLQLDEQSTAHALRAADICKFDLTTNMVIEFTELQGIIGEKYALAFGEDQAVAQAIREHYLPDKAQGALPQSTIGAMISVADKLDSVVGFLSVGLTPTGSQDPYGLRRQATGLLRILLEKNWQMKLEDLFHMACDLYEIEDRARLLQDLHEFFVLRVAYLFKERQIEQDVIDAVFAQEFGILSLALKKAEILSAKRHDESFKTVYEGLTRILNLAHHEQAGKAVDPSLFETSSEQALYEKVQAIKQDYQEALMQSQADVALAKLSELATPIHDFFDHNMVMAEDQAIRQNRLALVNDIAELIYDFADLTKIQWKK